MTDRIMNDTHTDMATLMTSDISLSALLQYVPPFSGYQENQLCNGVTSELPR